MSDITTSTTRKTIVFFPLNSPGHINSSLGIADRLRQDHGHRIVFLLLGSMIGDSIREHGHELIILNEVNPYEDYEVEDCEDPGEPVSEEIKQRQGKTKKRFEGVHKWPQLLMRYERLFQLDPAEAFVKSCDVMEENMVAELVDNHPNYEVALRQIKPDLIIIDSYYVPPCVMQLGVPWARLYSANPLMLVKSKLPQGVKPPPMCGFKLYNKRERDRMRSEEPARWQAILDEWRTTNEYIFKAMYKSGSKLNDFLASHGCDPLPLGQQAHDSPQLNIYMFPRVLDYTQDDDLFERPVRWYPCDSLMRKQATPADSDEIRNWAQKLERSLANNKEAVIFFSLGSLASGNSNLMKRYVEMFKYDKRRLYVVSKGVNGDKYELCPDNMIGGNYIPQTFFLARASLAIIHGGNNSITECMYYGLPMIVLPVFADQLDNAQRVEDLGYGRRLNVLKCTREELADTIDSILGDSVLIDRMRDIGRKMQSRDDLGKVANLLNKLMDDGKLDEKLLTDVE